MWSGTVSSSCICRAWWMALQTVEALQCVLLNESLCFQWGGVIQGKYMNIRYIHDSCQQENFQTYFCLCCGWVLQTFIQKGSPPYQICFFLSFLWEVEQWYGIFEFSEAHVNSLSKGLNLRHRETLYGYFMSKVITIQLASLFICFKNWKANHKVRVRSRIRFWYLRSQENNTVLVDYICFLKTWEGRSLISIELFLSLLIDSLQILSLNVSIFASFPGIIIFLIVCHFCLSHLISSALFCSFLTYFTHYSHNQHFYII